MEAQLEKENRMMQLNTTGHNYSHDSAIDTDLQEWDTEMLNIDLVGIRNLAFISVILLDELIIHNFFPLFNFRIL